MGSFSLLIKGEMTSIPLKTKAKGPPEKPFKFATGEPLYSYFLVVQLGYGRNI